MDDQYNPILDGYYATQGPSKNGWPVQSNSGWICDCLSKNQPSLHLPVFQEIPF